MLAQNPSSFLDSAAAGGSLSDDAFLVDGPLFAELLDTVGVGTLELETGENINIMESDSEDDMEKYFSGKVDCDTEAEKHSTDNIETVTEQVAENTSSRPVLLRKTASKVERVPAPLRIRKNNENSENSSLRERRASTVDESSTRSDSCAELDGSTDGRLCMSKNAVAARENRQKKKQYVDSLEQRCERLTNENFVLKNNLVSKDKKIASMANEIEYLHSVIKNESPLSALLKNIHHTAGLKFGSSLLEESSQNSKRAADEDGETSLNDSKRLKTVSQKLSSSTHTTRASGQVFEGPPTPCASPEPKLSGGVCLHVSNNNVSLEFCPTCSSNAAEVWKVSGDHTYNRSSGKVIDYIGGYTVFKQEVDD